MIENQLIMDIDRKKVQDYLNGYFCDQEEFIEKIPDGWFKTKLQNNLEKYKLDVEKYGYTVKKVNL